MFKAKKRTLGALSAPFVVLSCAGLIGCASVGSPGGGLYDETPPVLRMSDPEEGATGVTKQKLTLRFDENIKLDNAMDKLTISPPQEKSPSIMSNAKTLTIELVDSLKPNTTYTIDLGDAVQDNNEGNPLESLTLTFSTGDHIDTMKISGVLLNAADLEPITGAYVGIYKVYDDGRLVEGDEETLHGVDSVVALYPDSVFMLKPFERAGKTDAEGRFKISGVGSGKYRIYALADGNTNYRYDLFDEDIAFSDSLIVPSVVPCQVYDTIYSKRNFLSLEVATSDSRDEKEQERDSMPIDTIIVRDGYRYLPDNVLLLAFNEGRVNRYLDEVTWPDSLHINVRFSANMPTPPTIRLLGADSLGVAAVDKDSWLICEPNLTNDTLSYWIRDSLIYTRDTLELEISYLFTEEGVDVMRTDTVPLYNPRPKPDEKSKKKDKKDKDAELPADSLSALALNPVDSLLTDSLAVAPLSPAEDEAVAAEEEIADSKSGKKKDSKKDKKKSQQKKKKKGKKEEQEAAADTVPKKVFVKVELLGKNTIDIGARPRFQCSAPLDSIDLTHLHLEQKKDSIWEKLDFRLEQDSLILRRYTLHAIPHFSPGGSYRLIADSASMHDVYGHPVDSTCITFSEMKVEDYAHLVFNITGVEGPAYVQLLDEKDKPVKQIAVKDGQAKFVNIPAGKYYARLVEDFNNNGKFDPGSVLDGLQPERVYYFESLLELRTWQYSQSWNIHAKPISLQKPRDLIQNKPKEKAKKKNRNEEYLRDHPELRKKYLNSLR